jgi:hypothetical protein
MTVSYEQARADVEGVIGHFPDPTCEHVLMRVDTLRALLAGPPVPSEEEVARTIYERVMDGPVVGEKPAWVPGGNSLKQDEARDHARAVLALFRSRING